MTVSKKIGNSVVRSRAKRLIREVFRRNRDILKSNYDLVINAKRSLAAIRYWELEGDFHRAIERLQQ
jgi:ribonuclease P protein component